MSDLISRQEAIDAVKKNTFRLTFAEEQNCEGHLAWSANAVYSDVIEGALLDLPAAQPDKEKISDALYRIYLNTSPHTSAEGVAAIKYYIAEIWREIYGEEGPGWMR